MCGYSFSNWAVSTEPVSVLVHPRGSPGTLENMNEVENLQLLVQTDLGHRTAINKKGCCLTCTPLFAEKCSGQWTRRPFDTLVGRQAHTLLGWKNPQPRISNSEQPRTCQLRWEPRSRH